MGGRFIIRHNKRDGWFVRPPIYDPNESQLHPPVPISTLKITSEKAKIKGKMETL